MKSWLEATTSTETVIPDPTLQTFKLANLAQFTREGRFDPRDSSDFRVFYVGRDNVHGLLAYLLGRCSQSLKFNQFGYDDSELDTAIRKLVDDEHVFVQGTLDKSQASGVHEKAILAGWDEGMRNSFAIGESATHQITHTKGGVLDGLVAWEGSTNWSGSGEGTDPKRAQNNTLAVYTNPIEIQKFSIELDEEHATVLHQLAA
jgi:hypothetical protein